MKLENKSYRCKVCSKEIPQSVAHTAEGADYVWHFCGDCYKQEEANQSKVDLSKNK